MICNEIRSVTSSLRQALQDIKTRLKVINKHTRSLFAQLLSQKGVFSKCYRKEEPTALSDDELKYKKEVHSIKVVKLSINLNNPAMLARSYMYVPNSLMLLFMTCL